MFSALGMEEAVGSLLLGGHYMTFTLSAYARGGKVDVAGEIEVVQMLTGLRKSSWRSIMLKTQDDMVDKNVLEMSAQH